MRSCTTFSLAAMLCLVSACASNPDKIDAAYVSPLKYQDYDCKQLATEMDYVGQRTTKLYQRLKAERTADNWQMGVGLVLFWPTLFFLEGGDGPEAAEYAQLKGEYEALRTNSVEKECSITAMSPEEIMKGAEEKERSEANIEDGEVGTKHNNEVVEIANSMDCKGAVSLQEVTEESETWILQCGDGESLTIKCFDGACYANQ